MKETFQVFKIHSDFYYVRRSGEIFECKLKETLKKSKQDVVVGDFAVLESINENSKQAVISDIRARKTFIARPKVANLEQMIIVSSIKEPDLDFTQLNRYICLCGYHKIRPVLCFNKNDLSSDDSIIETVFSIYEELGYEIIFTSALEKTGIEDIEEVLQGKTSALCGQSGVGKSTLINAINPDLNIKTKKVSEKTERGVHTTRHSEIIRLKLHNGKTADLIDTPGFSHLKFDFILPIDLDSLFPEIFKYSKGCKFKDCLHIEEAGCNVLNNIDKINISRYDSYRVFLEETKEYKIKVAQQGSKKEEKFKYSNDKKLVKISIQKRQSARSADRQKLKAVSEEYDV